MINLIGKVMELVLPWALTKLLEWGNKRWAEKMTEADVIKKADERLAEFNNAYQKAIDGKPITEEQKKELEAAIRNFTKE